MALLEDLHTSVEVNTVVVDDRARNAGAGRRVLQTLSDVLSGGRLHWHQIDQGHILGTQATCGHRQVDQPDPQDRQNLHFADLDRMVDQPDPIRSWVFALVQSRQAKPKQPHAARGPVWSGEWQAEEPGNELQHSAGCAQRDPELNQSKKQRDHAGRITMGRGHFFEGRVVSRGGRIGYFFFELPRQVRPVGPGVRRSGPEALAPLGGQHRLRFASRLDSCRRPRRAA